MLPLPRLATGQRLKERPSEVTLGPNALDPEGQQQVKVSRIPEPRLS